MIKSCKNKCLEKIRKSKHAKKVCSDRTVAFSTNSKCTYIFQNKFCDVVRVFNQVICCTSWERNGRKLNGEPVLIKLLTAFLICSFMWIITLIRHFDRKVFTLQKRISVTDFLMLIVIHVCRLLLFRLNILNKS